MKTFLSSLVSLSLIAGLGWLPAQAGPLAPKPRVIADRDRDFLEWSGAQTLEELLDTGIVRYFFTGGQPLPVLVNGRPYASTAHDLDTLPLSAIERIELLSGDSLGTLGGGRYAAQSMSSCGRTWTASRRGCSPDCRAATAVTAGRAAPSGAETSARGA